VCIQGGRRRDGRREAGKKNVESGAITTWPQLSKDAVSAKSYGGVCTGCFIGLVLHGSARQHKAGFTSVDIFDETAVNKRNKRLLDPLEQVLVIGAYFYDLGSEKREHKQQRLVVQGLPGCQSRARPK
jgi:hypothetical protein